MTWDLKSKIDTIWNAFWSGGIANPLEVIAQITYLALIRRLDDLQTLAEKKANRTGQPIENPLFQPGQGDLRWSRFKDLEPGVMHQIVGEGVFKPYAGVSTAILFFTKTNSGGTDHVWFYDVQADGFSLDDKRNPIEANDLPDVSAGPPRDQLDAPAPKVTAGRVRHVEADSRVCGRNIVCRQALLVDEHPTVVAVLRYRRPTSARPNGRCPLLRRRRSAARAHRCDVIGTAREPSAVALNLQHTACGLTSGATRCPGRRLRGVRPTR